MTESRWHRITRRLGLDHPPMFLVNHYLRRCCTCHKWPWQRWSRT